MGNKWKLLLFVLTTIFIAGATFFYIPYLVTQKSWLWAFDQQTGVIGDTIGGIAGSIVGFIAVILTFAAFYMQYTANKRQDEQIGEQAKSWEIERFENKFYNLLGLHRDNVNEVKIGKKLSGRKAFISMFNELKYVYYEIQYCYNNKYKIEINTSASIPPNILYNIAYLSYFFGIGSKSSAIIFDLIGQEYEGFFGCFHQHIIDCQSKWRKWWKEDQARKRKLVNEKEKSKLFKTSNSNLAFSLNIVYVPCSGHTSIYSHYIRHLYQLVKFVDDADEKIITPEKKYQYVATIRSQLSIHEQLLIYYNALSVLGEPWLKSESGVNYLKKYSLLKSLPITLTKDFYKNPEDLLGKENEYNKPMFEWLEIKKRFQELPT
jgi:hypothetical protein